MANIPIFEHPKYFFRDRVGRMITFHEIMVNIAYYLSAIQPHGMYMVSVLHNREDPEDR